MKQELDSVIIAANFFNGNELSELSCQIDNSQPVVLSKTKMKDPFAERLNMENLADYNNKLSSRDSNHIWAAKLPADLSIGIHKIIVIANDEYGNEFRQSAIFEVK
jgi:hypothetical protein